MVLYRDGRSNKWGQSTIVSNIREYCSLAPINLAFALIKWAQWGWGNFSMQEHWRSKEVNAKDKSKDV